MKRRANAVPLEPPLLFQEGCADEAEGLRLGSVEIRFQRQGDPDWEEGFEDLRPVNLSTGIGRVCPPHCGWAVTRLELAAVPDRPAGERGRIPSASG